MKIKIKRILGIILATILISGLIGLVTIAFDSFVKAILTIVVCIFIAFLINLTIHLLFD